ncbi:neuronal PAS domain-containing protein 4 isoform X2 [Protopterus annectens]|uniref:neuronal PAS domain-containing protein 4 isoform X2 n=1 Tax=Protopterus annectens TaxID=7888 RepID=UPI001CFA4133|nr:neuronal PAS domain-containing protein 4 isoform X2 [Protopterus annectens]
MYRSTKGASKARRDQINAEIRNLKELLPIAEAEKARLSYLHIMSLACIYTRKSVFFSEGEYLQEREGFLSSEDLDDFIQTLPGFLIVTTGGGKLIYVSENVTDHLGHCMVDLVAQGDSIYDIVDPADHFVMRNNLTLTTSSDTERLFRCRFNTSKSVRRQSAGNKLVLIRGRFHDPPAGSYWSSNPVFSAFCIPLDPKPQMTENSFFFSFFESRHAKDMAVLDVSDSVSLYLGYEKETLLCNSWYSLVHPEDISHVSSQHYRLLNEASDSRVEMVLRLQAKDSYWVWVYLVLQTGTTEIPVTGYNYIISESEAWCLRQQLVSEETQLAYILRTTASYQEDLLSPEHLSSPDQVFTPVSGTPTDGISVQTFDFSGVCNVDCTQEYSEGATIVQADLQISHLGSTSGNISTGEDAARTIVSRQEGKDSEINYSNCMFVPGVPYEQKFRRDMLSSSSKELACTPPYTPHQGGCSFMFGSQESFPQSTMTDLFYPQENCSVLYEKLPPTPDSPGNGDCTLMRIPEVRAPLYIAVPLLPDGILTPEASPVKQSFFRYSEKEKTEIDLLAKQISSLAEDFSSFATTKPSFQEQTCTKHNPVVRSCSLPASTSSTPTPNNSSDFQQIKQWRSIDFSLLACPEEICFEENVIENISKDLLTHLFQKSETGVICHHQLCGDASSPLSLDTETTCSLAPSPSTDLSPEEQSFLEELASYETVFETCASRSPCDGFNDELYQLQNNMQDGFHTDGSGGDPSF